jgi:3-oxoacyl-[acyl-carrier-protein] synthase III
MGNYLFADDYFYGWQERIGKDFAVEGIKKALKEANLTLSDLDMVVIHQTISALIERWIKGGEEVGIGRDKWKETWNKYGNIGNVDIVPNLEELWHEGKITKGSIIALFPPGGGGHTPCMIIRWLV